MDNRKTSAFAEAITQEERRAAQWTRDYNRMQSQGFQAPDQGPPQGSYQPSFSSSYRLQSRGGQAPPQGPPPGSRGGSRGGRRGTMGATRIGTPQYGPLDYPQNVERTVTRQVEVPYTRQVKVPVRRNKIVSTKVQHRIPTKRLVEVPSFEVVDEEYTEIMDQPAVRNKEIWVKKVVPEHYMKKIPVTKMRQVTKPTTVIKEVDDFQVVELDGTKAIEVDGYRIDEVQDMRVQEIEEIQNYRLHPQPDGEARVQDVRDVSSFNQSRRIGTHVYSPDDMRVTNLPQDNSASMASTLPSIRARTSVPGSRARRTGTSIPRSRLRASTQQLRPIGCLLMDSDGSSGCLVKRVNAGSVASESGLCANDLITYVNNRPTRNMNEFKNVISVSGKSTCVTVQRGSMVGQGIGTIKLTLVR